MSPRGWRAGADPAHASACGKALLAALPETAAGALATPLQRSTAQTIVDPGELERALERVRREALAYDRDEFPEGVNGLATFACARDDNPVALGLVVPTARLEAKLPVLRNQVLAARGELQRGVEAL